MAKLFNGVIAIDTVLDALGYEGDLIGRQPRQTHLVTFARHELRQFLVREL